MTANSSPPSKTIADREKLITDLKALIKWTEENSMEFNDDKFQLLQIGPDSLLKLPYKFNNLNIQKSSHVRDLGVYMSENLSFTYHITEMTINATNCASWLLRIFRTRKKIQCCYF